MRGGIAIVTLSIAIATLYACSSSSSSSPTADDAGAGDGAAPKKDAGTVDVDQPEAIPILDDDGGIVAIRCTATEYGAHDYTDAGADVVVAHVQGPTSQAPAQYDPNCLRVKVGAKVEFKGSFALHPIQIDFKPDSGAGATTGGGGVTTLYNFPGEFGFECRAHPSAMYGAVQVVP